MAENQRRGFDQFIVVVNDLDEAGEAWRRMGFTVLPKSRQTDHGSSSHIVQLCSSYLNLLGDTHLMSPGFSDYYSARLMLGGGIATFSLASNDLEQDRCLLLEQGFDPSPCGSAHRAVTMPDGKEAETNSRFFHIGRRDQPYLAPFWCEQLTPEAVFIPEYQQHPNAVRDVLGIVIRSCAVAEDVHFLQRVSGGDVAEIEGGRQLSLRGGQTVDLLSCEYADRKYGSAMSAPSNQNSLIVGLKLETRSLRQSERALHPSVERTQFENSLLVQASWASGVFLQFIEQSERASAAVEKGMQS